VIRRRDDRRHGSQRVDDRRGRINYIDDHGIRRESAVAIIRRHCEHVRAGSITQIPDLAVIGITPGVAALATWLIYQRNVRGFGWRLGPSRYVFFSYLLPGPEIGCLRQLGVDTPKSQDMITFHKERARSRFARLAPIEGDGVMRSAALLAALFYIVIGLGGLVWPGPMLAVRQQYLSLPAGLYTFGAIRVAMGLALILCARASRAPTTLRVLGSVICVQGLAAFLGVERARAVLELEAPHVALARVGALVAFATGSFMAFAILAGRPHSPGAKQPTT
jgi:hypothetical protein